MPKELIGNERVRVQVNWGRDTEEVLVGTVHLDEPEYTVERGRFMSLSRSQINELIRVLRKARDQAYGKDE